MVEGETTRTTTTTPTKKRQKQQQQQQQQQKQLLGVPKNAMIIFFSILDPFLTVFWPSDDPNTLQTLFQVLIILSYQSKSIKRVFRISKQCTIG